VTPLRAVRGALAVAFACTVLAGHAEPVAYRVDPARTRVEFSVLHLGVLRAHGRFTQASGRIVYDAAAHAGSIDFDVAGESVATGWTLRDSFIRGENMFDVEHHPVVRFHSTRLAFETGRLVRVDGDLTLRGVTRPIALAVLSLECGHAGEAIAKGCAADVDGMIRRSDFGMDVAWPLIADEVSLRFVIGAVRE
jgi:polyisoprenoid-binding protein YceI